MATCIVTFNYKGGTGSPATAEVTVGAAYGPLPVPTKAGNEFGGWYSADTHGSLVEATTLVTAEDDHTLFARWIPERVTVTFNVPQGAVVTPPSKIVEKTFRYGWLPTPTRTGYVFVKWNTAADGRGTDVNSESIVPVSNPPTVLYAIWTPATYRITFDVNGGFTIPAAYRTQVYTYGQPFGRLGPRVMYTTTDWDWREWGPRVAMLGGYTYGEVTWAAKAAVAFLGWFDDPTEGRQYTEDEICYLDHDMVLFAHWDYSRLAGHVTFDPNGGIVEGSDEPIVKDYMLLDGAAAYKFGRLPKARRDGCAFLGWFTLPDDKLIKCDNKWSGVPYNEGWYAATSHDLFSKTEKVTKDSYRPIGETITDPPQNRQVNDIHRVGADLTLYAHWSRYEVNLDHQGARTAEYFVEKVMATYGELLPTVAAGGYFYPDLETLRKDLPPVPAKPGYTFGGYYEKPNGQGTQYYAPPDPGELCCKPVAVWDKFGGGTIYAYWIKQGPDVPKTVTVTFSCLRPLSFSSKVVTVGQQYGELPEVTNKGYVVTGYHARIENYDDPWDPYIELEITPTTICEAEEDHTVGVSVTNASYAVKLVANGGTINSGNITSYYPNYSTGKTLPTNVTRQGYTFGGWYESPDFSGSAVRTITGTGDKVYYAKWTGTAYTLTFNANGGTVSPSSKSLEYGGHYGALPTPTRTGWIFEGWFTSATGGSRVIAEDPFTGSAAVTLYAHWSIEPTPPDPGHAVWGYVKYKIKLVLNGGELTDTAYELKYMAGFPKTLPTANQVAKTGGTFAGWYAAADFSGSPIETIPATATGSKTYYAKWA